MSCSINPIFHHIILTLPNSRTTVCPFCGDDVAEEFPSTSGVALSEATTSTFTTTDTIAQPAQPAQPAQLIAEPIQLEEATAITPAELDRHAMAILLRKSIGAGKELRKKNSAIASKAKAKAIQNIEVIKLKPTVQQPTQLIEPPLQQPIKLVLKVAHRMYDYVDNQDCGCFTSFTTRGHVIVYPVQANRRFTYRGFVETLLEFCRKNWPGGHYVGNYKKVFKIHEYKDYIGNHCFKPGFTVWTGHLQDDDDVGVNLRRLPLWPIDKTDKVEDLSVQEILVMASWAEQEDDSGGKSKGKAQLNSYNLTLVYEWLYQPREESPELGSCEYDNDDNDDWGLGDLYADDTTTTEPIDNTTAAAATTTTAPPEPPLTSSSSSAHKRGVSHTTPQSKRE